jgi:hypothetical protein
MNVDVRYLSGDEAGDPCDHPSFISTVDDLCKKLRH